MLKKVYDSAVFGIEAFTITVEVNVTNGIGYNLVGLLDNAIKESNFRIAAALQNNGYKIPGKNIIIYMSPATSFPAVMHRYLGKISGPLLDRIDIHVEVTPVPFEKLTQKRIQSLLK